MSCGKIQRLIQPYVDGAATRSERETVDAHVAACEACARALEDSRRLVTLLAGMPARRVRPQFEADLTAALRHTAPVSQSAAWWERFRLRFEWRLRFPAMVAAGGLAVAVIAAVVTPAVVTYQDRQEERTQFLTAAVERHRQLEGLDTQQDFDAVDSSIDLSTGSLVTE